MSLRRHHRSAVGEVETASLLVVRLGKHFYALPSQGVRGVLAPEEAQSARTVCAGGESYHDVRLVERLALTRDSVHQDMRTVLYSIGDFHGAIQVDAVIGMHDIARKLCRRLPPQFQGIERNWISGTTLFRGQIVLILNAEWVLEELNEGLLIQMGAKTHSQSNTKLACGA